MSPGECTYAKPCISKYAGKIVQQELSDYTDNKSGLHIGSMISMNNVLVCFQSVVSETDEKPVLQLVNLVAGHYTFKLEVADEAGLTSTDTASINVKSGENLLSILLLIVVLLSASISCTDRTNFFQVFFINNLELYCKIGFISSAC